MISPPTLHPSVLESDEHKDEASTALQAITDEATEGTDASVAPTDELFSINLTTISLAGNFDACINIQFDGGGSASLLVDSGNSVLIVPYWEHIDKNPAYTVLGDATQPWRGPAKVVRGPILIPTANRGLYTLRDCVFYACTGAPRTANFGTGCITPWSASDGNTPPNLGVVMQAPLSYNKAYPYAEFVYAAAGEIFSEGDRPNLSGGSLLVMHRSLPPGYTMLNTKQNLAWMSVSPRSLTIGTTVTRWPGPVTSVTEPIAMVDTGGGPVLLSDPDGYVYNVPWPNAVSPPDPGWISASESCSFINDPLGLELCDGTTAYSYAIDTSKLPPSVQGLTAMVCKVNGFMRGQPGMNIGGISALFNRILIDYNSPRVGFKPR